MGQTYCQNCCMGDKAALNSYSDMDSLKYRSLQNSQNHTPLQQFAIRVEQGLELNPTVREVYYKYRTEHFAERKGFDLSDPTTRPIQSSRTVSSPGKGMISTFSPQKVSSTPLYYLFNYSAYYEGEWKNGLPHGMGKLSYDDGSFYEGCFDNGYAHCHEAIFINQNGTFYRGGVKENKAEGQGELSTVKFYYKGGWKDDLPEGQGKQIYGPGMSYEGEFQRGKKHGSGVYYWNSREYYIGQFRENMMQGTGECVLKNFNYKGEFVQGQKSGKGKLINLLNRSVYEGEFLDDEMNGKGVYQWEDGTLFEGVFKNGSRTQEGKFTFAKKKRAQNLANFHSKTSSAV